MGIAAGYRHFAAGQSQAERLQTLGKLQHPVTQQRQPGFHITIQLLQIQPLLAARQADEILDQQALPAGKGFPVQARLRVTRLEAAQPLKVIGALATGTPAFFLLILAESCTERQRAGQRSRIDQRGLIQIDPTPGHQQAQRKLAFHP